MNRSLAKRLRWPLLCLGLLAVLVGVAGWWLRPTDPIGPRAFERIQLGMTEEEVEAVIGLPAGKHTERRGVWSKEVGMKGWEFVDPRIMGLIPSYKWWDGTDYQIIVGFDLEGQVIGVYLYVVTTPEPSFLDRLRTRFGL